MSIGTDVVHEGFGLCESLFTDYPATTFFTEKIIISKDRWYQRLLHKETGGVLQNATAGGGTHDGHPARQSCLEPYLNDTLAVEAFNQRKHSEGHKT